MRTLLPTDFELWRHVARSVPHDALVFTSLTGPSKPAASEGQSFYPAIARRQLYLAGWANSSLLVERAKLRRRLAVNRAVLAGRLAPEQAPLSRRYRAYFAAVRRTERVPPSFRRVYENDAYALYRIEP